MTFVSFASSNFGLYIPKPHSTSNDATDSELGSSSCLVARKRLQGDKEKDTGSGLWWELPALRQAPQQCFTSVFEGGRHVQLLGIGATIGLA